MRPRFGSCGARYWKFISSIVASFGASTWNAYMSTRSRTHGMRLPFAVTMRPASSLAGFDGECVPGTHSVCDPLCWWHRRAAKSCRDKACQPAQQWAEEAVLAVGQVNSAYARLRLGQCIEPRKPLQRLYDGKMNAACRSSETPNFRRCGREMVWSITRAESYVRETVKSMKPGIWRGLKRMGDVKPP